MSTREARGWSKSDSLMLVLPLVVAALLIWGPTFFNYLQDGRVGWFSIYMCFFAIFFAWFVCNYVKKMQGRRSGG